jgi:hypothetical protein
VLRLFSDISNSNERHVVNNNLGGFWKGKVVVYTKVQALKGTKSSTFKAGAMRPPPPNRAITTNKLLYTIF